jgi:4-hydroxy-tetrahydrodipicolinate synthase
VDLDGGPRSSTARCPQFAFENRAWINLALRREIYRRRGAIASSRLRSPFTPVDEDTLRDLDEFLRRLAL